LEYIFRSLPPIAPIGCEVRKPTTRDLTQTLRLADVRAKQRNYCSDRKALHSIVSGKSEHTRHTLKSARLQLWQVAGEGERRCQLPHDSQHHCLAAWNGIRHAGIRRQRIPRLSICTSSS
jgi:hypothetical protein